MPKIKLQSSDEVIFEVDLEIAQASELIKTMLEDLGMADDGQEVIPLPKVHSTILKKVIEWIEFHRSDPPPPKEEEEDDDDRKVKKPKKIGAWDAEFIKKNTVILCDLLVAANYLSVSNLLELACRMTADLIRGKNPTEVQSMFNITEPNRKRKRSNS